MKITIESTDTLTMINSVPCRHWRGTTAAGVPCDVFVLQIAVRSDQDAADFVAELEECPPPDELFLPLRETLP